MTTVREAYDGAARAWGEGPDRVFSALAAALLARGPAWSGLRVLDLGAGTGTATRRLVASGAQVVPVDASVEMLSVARRSCACSPVVADALALPVRPHAVDAAVLGFLLNHLPDPAAALRETAAAVRPAGWVLASTWARGHAHPVREATERALRARGWESPAWYGDLKNATTPLSDTPETLAAAAAAAGLLDVAAVRVDVQVPASAQDLVEWRLGLPHTAPFVAALAAPERAGLFQELEAEVLTQPGLVCALVLLTSRVA